MSNHIWLPPLNSHDQTHVYVQISQTVPADSMKSIKRPMFLMNFRACVDFISDNQDTTQRSFRGLSVWDYYHIPCDYITSEFSKTFIGVSLYNFSSMGFGGDIMWAERDLNWEEATCCQLFEDTDIFDKIQKFLCGMIEKEYNVGKNILMFNLIISKKITIPDEELKSWNSWYDQKKRSDPNFELEFRQAISRPRTEEELINEINSIASGFTLMSSIWEEVEVVEVGKLNSQKFCLICLEEFLLDSQVTKLSCGHIFDENCIRKWLQQRNTCPLCRFTFQNSIIN